MRTPQTLTEHKQQQGLSDQAYSTCITMMITHNIDRRTNLSAEYYEKIRRNIHALTTNHLEQLIPTLTAHAQTNNEYTHILSALRLEYQQRYTK